MIPTAVYTVANSYHYYAAPNFPEDLGEFIHKLLTKRFLNADKVDTLVVTNYFFHRRKKI